MPLKDAQYDVVIGQESWLHIPGKKALIQQCARVVVPAGTIAFTNILANAALLLVLLLLTGALVWPPLSLAWLL